MIGHDKILQMAIDAGADAASLSLRSGVQRDMIYFNGKLDSVQSAADNSLSINIYKDGRWGSFSTNRMEEESLRSFIENGVSLTKILQPDPFRRLPEADRYYKGDGPDLGICDDDFSKIEDKEKRMVAQQLSDEIVATAGERLKGYETEYGEGEESMLLADTNGFVGRRQSTLFCASAQCSVTDDDGSIPESYRVESEILFNQLNYEGCGSIAAKEALESLGGRRVDEALYDIVVDARSVRKLVSPLISALSASSVDQGNSFLADSVGKQLFSEKLNLFDNPHKRGCRGARHFDMDGIASKPYDIIKNGVVERFFVSNYYSQKMGLQQEVSSPSVLELCPTASNLDRNGLMQLVGEGILITGFCGGNQNSVTADFSYGIQGYYFKNGKIVHPVRGMNVTGNLIKLWSALISVGDDFYQSAHGLTGSIAFEKVSIC
ncbi:MAG: TldD/PmbA family protein [Bacteroidales bacterium]|nr:TldD/PmbA family protein [Bacteroidales bacterium]